MILKSENEIVSKCKRTVQCILWCVCCLHLYWSTYWHRSMSQLVTRVDISDRYKSVGFKSDCIWLMKSNFNKINRISTQTNLMAFGLCSTRLLWYQELVAMMLKVHLARAIALYTSTKLHFIRCTVNWGETTSWIPFTPLALAPLLFSFQFVINHFHRIVSNPKLGFLTI